MASSVSKTNNAGVISFRTYILISLYCLESKLHREDLA